MGFREGFEVFPYYYCGSCVGALGTSAGKAGHYSLLKLTASCCFISFCSFEKSRKVFYSYQKKLCLNSSMIHLMARLEFSLSCSCPAALGFLGVMPPSLRDRLSSYPKFTCCHFYFFFRYVWPSNRAKKLILFHAGSTAMKSAVTSTWD